MEAELEGLQSQVAARKEAIQLRKNASRPELGEPAKRERREATATGSRKARRMTEIRREQIAAERCVPPTEKP